MVVGATSSVLTLGCLVRWSVRRRVRQRVGHYVEGEDTVLGAMVSSALRAARITRSVSGATLRHGHARVVPVSCAPRPSTGCRGHVTIGPCRLPRRAWPMPALSHRPGRACCTSRRTRRVPVLRASLHGGGGAGLRRAACFEQSSSRWPIPIRCRWPTCATFAHRRFRGRRWRRAVLGGSRERRDVRARRAMVSVVSRSMRGCTAIRSCCSVTNCSTDSTSPHQHHVSVCGLATPGHVVDLASSRGPVA